MAGSVEIVEIGEPIRYVFVDHVGPYFETAEAFQELFTNSKLKDLLLPPLQRISIWLDDPDVTASKSLRSRLGFVLPSDASFEPEAPIAEIRKGKYAKMTFEGKRSELLNAWQFLYGVWFPHSEQVIQLGFPGFQIDHEVGGDFVRSHLYIELKA